MTPRPLSLKAERVQDRSLPVTPERLQDESHKIGDWQVDPTPNAIYRRFVQPSFSASAAFLVQAAAAIETHGRPAYAVVDATGVTVRLGNPPLTGVTEADVDLAAAINAMAA